MYEGKVFKTGRFGDVKVICYESTSNVLVRFLNTGYEGVFHMSAIRSGQIKDKTAPTTYAIGVIGDGVDFPRHKKEYTIWSSMLCRCYNLGYLEGKSTYKDCEVSENFKYFPYFKEWCNKQAGFGNKDWHLDKDILMKGNKVYSEDTCCFVPSEINVLFTKRQNRRGEHHIGVNYIKRLQKFQASVNVYGNRVYIGVYNTSEEAFYAYKEAKETHIKEVANKWKDQIDVKVYNALMNYKVEIDD